VLDNTVADLIFGLIISSARRISELDKYVKEGNWKQEDEKNLFGLDVHHSTVGIIGMGRIGEAVAKRAKLGFDMEVLYYNRSRKHDVENRLGAKYCDFQSLLQKSDFIVLMTPLTKDTYHLIDFEEFNMMKKTAIFINASRGETVNEEALIEALKNNKIFGAGLDVYDSEPIDSENLLLQIPNVITLPHIGSAVEKTRLDMAMRAAENLVKAVLGETPSNVVPELKTL
jgi:Lactate dehydrogenase and related dehydrogenases